MDYNRARPSLIPRPLLPPDYGMEKGSTELWLKKLPSPDYGRGAGGEGKWVMTYLISYVMLTLTVRVICPGWIGTEAFGAAPPPPLPPNVSMTREGDDS